MPFVLPADPSDGQIAPASWGDEVRAALNWLANPPACRANRTSAQSVAHGTDTAIQFNAADTFDTAAMHDPASNNTRVTAPATGIYVVMMQLYWASGGAAMIPKLRVNGTTEIGSIREDQAGTLNQQSVSTWKFTTGDYVEAVAFQFSGDAVNVDIAWLSMVYVGLG